MPGRSVGRNGSGQPVLSPGRALPGGFRAGPGDPDRATNVLLPHFFRVSDIEDDETLFAGFHFLLHFGSGEPSDLPFHLVQEDVGAHDDR